MPAVAPQEWLQVSPDRDDLLNSSPHTGHGVITPLQARQCTARFFGVLARLPVDFDGRGFLAGTGSPQVEQ